MNAWIFRLLAACGFLISTTGAHAQLFVTQAGSNTIIDYDSTTGAALNSSYITGINDPEGIAAYGNYLYIANAVNGGGTISEYYMNTNGTTTLLSSSMISGLNAPTSLYVSGTTLYVADIDAQKIETFSINTSTGYAGNVANASFATSGISYSQGMVVIGNYLFVADVGSNTISEYNATTGAVINTAAVSTGLSRPIGLTAIGNELFVTDNSGSTLIDYAIDTSTGAVGASKTLLSGLASEPFDVEALGNNLYIDYNSTGTVGEYSYNSTTNSVSVVNSALVTGLSNPGEMLLLPVTAAEPSSWAFDLCVIGLIGALYQRARLVAKEDAEATVTSPEPSAVAEVVPAVAA